MITVIDRNELQFPGSATARYQGSEHGADASRFWVRAPPGECPDPHWHPYIETWVILDGQVSIDPGDEHLQAHPGAIVTVPAHTVHAGQQTGASLQLTYRIGTAY